MAEDPSDARAVPPWLARAAAWSWRALVIGAAFVAVGYAASRLRLVLLPLGIGLLLSTALVPPARALTRLRLRPLLATWITFIGFLGGLTVLFVLIVPPVVDEFGNLGDTLEDAGEEVEDWLVDGPLGLDRETVDDLRDDIFSTDGAATPTNGTIVDSAVLAGEVVAGIVLSLVVAFFLVKDGAELQRWFLARVPERHRDRSRHVAAVAYSTLGRYLLGAATLGAVEAVIIGATMAITGSDVVLPVAVITFLGAFFPFVGALVSGVIAVLVSLVSSGPEAAIVVAIVAVLVQQFDNELLAPFIYSRALKLHPLVVILAVATGAAIGGLIGAFIAVPVAAVAINSWTAAAVEPDEPEEAPDPA